MLSADVNVRNERGMTVLHVAAWRRDPLAIAKLVEKGAQLQALTLDNQTALDISKRLTRKFNLVGEENFKDSLCVSILQQAERSVAVPNAAAAMLEQPCTEKDLMSKLLYLENRGQCFCLDAFETLSLRQRSGKCWSNKQKHV